VPVAVHTAAGPVPSPTPCVGLLERLFVLLDAPQMTRILGVGGEGAENLPDQLLGKVEGMLDVVREVSRELK
jgi:hypothetical protein